MSELWQKIKCVFGFHSLKDESGIDIQNPDGTWRAAQYCQHCSRGGDRL